MPRNRRPQNRVQGNRPGVGYIPGQRTVRSPGGQPLGREGVSNVPGDRVGLPEVPFRPPSGSYDVGLDAAERGAKRGLKDLLNDLGRDQERDDIQQEWQTGDITRGSVETLADIRTRDTRFARDLGTNRARGTADYGLAKGRVGEDYQSGLAGLARGYGRLGQSQKQGFLSAGGQAGPGGALAQAARKRAENEAWDRKPLDTGFARQNDNLDRAWGRQQEDWSTGEQDWNADSALQNDRTVNNADRQLGRSSVVNNWGATDRITQGTRAKREGNFFGQDTQAARVQQVQQTAPGWLADWNRRNRERGFRPVNGGGNR